MVAMCTTNDERYLQRYIVIEQSIYRCRAIVRLKKVAQRVHDKSTPHFELLTKTVYRTKAHRGRFQ